jgi:hypothetical protein
MFTTVQEFVLYLVKSQTALGISKLPKKSSAAQKEKVYLSEKAIKAKEYIEEGHFGCNTTSVGSLVSMILGEDLQIQEEKDDDEFDHGNTFKVPDYSLLICIHDTSDDEGQDIKKGEMIFNIGTSDDEFNEAVSEMVKAQGKKYLNNRWNCEYDLENIYENDFRFATSDEIEKYLKKAPLRFYNYWFKQIVMILKLSKNK